MKRQQSTYRFTGRQMLACVLGFFGIVIGVNIGMAYAAIHTFPGLNAHNGYVASQTYNLLLDEAAAQEKRGWTATVTECDGRIQLRIVDAGGKIIDWLDMAALAGRPASAAQDRELALMHVGDAYVTGEKLPRGRWLVSFEGRHDGAVVWRVTRPLTIAQGTDA